MNAPIFALFAIISNIVLRHISCKSPLALVNKEEPDFYSKIPLCIALSIKGTNQYCKKLNSAPKTPTKAYSVVNDLKNALSKEACRIIHSLQRWINANKLLLL